MQAKYYGLKQAMDEGFKYYLHLDDDDIWSLNHIHEHYNTIIQFPQVDFMYTISKFCKIYLPRKTVGSKIALQYNNRKVSAADVVHSTWCINLHTIGPMLLQLYEKRIEMINNIRTKKIPERPIIPMDKNTIYMINSKPQLKKIFIPKVTCTKEKILIYHSLKNLYTI